MLPEDFSITKGTRDAHLHLQAHGREHFGRHGLAECPWIWDGVDPDVADHPWIWEGVDPDVADHALICDIVDPDKADHPLGSVSRQHRELGDLPHSTVLHCFGELVC